LWFRFYSYTKTVADVKKLFTGSNYLIPDNIYIKGKVTANDETGNLYRYIYIEDATGGIRININKANTIYQDYRFKVGKNLIVKLKDLYIGKYNGEFQIGTLSGSTLGFIAEADIYKYCLILMNLLHQLLLRKRQFLSLHQMM
jgi:hypothetical protein